MTVGFSIRRKTDHQWWRCVDRRRPLNTDSSLLAGAVWIDIPLPWLSRTSRTWELLRSRQSTFSGALTPDAAWLATDRGPGLRFVANGEVRGPATLLPGDHSCFLLTRLGASQSEYAQINGDGTAYGQWMIYLGSNAPTMYYSGNNQPANTALTPGQWAASGCSYDSLAASPEIRWYLDGRPDGVRVAAKTPQTPTVTALGGRGDGRNLFNGDIAAHILWSRTLSPSEWSALYDQSRRGWISGPNAILRTQSTRRYSFVATSGGTPASTLFRRGLQSRIGSRGAA